LRNGLCGYDLCEALQARSLEPCIAVSYAFHSKSAKFRTYKKVCMSQER
jgi:hypothetical protein